ncbi:MAG: hypothetical protein QXK85_00785 [Thermofilum sp.]
MLKEEVLEEIARRALFSAVRYGFPLEFSVERGYVRLSYRGRVARYRVLELLDPSGRVSGIGFALPGLEAYSIRVAEAAALPEQEFSLVFENIPAAVGLDVRFMSPAETDIWVRRFKLAGKLARVESPPEPLEKLRSLGLEVWATPDGIDYAVGKEGVVGLWYIPLFNRTDFAMEVQEKLGVHRWGVTAEEVRRLLGLQVPRR